jgi:GNAT superfamily N-acetyltransferase
MQSVPDIHAPVTDAAERLCLRDGTAVALRTSDDSERAAIAAQAEDRIAGEVSYARVYGPRAEVSIAIDDAFWHRGLPELLLSALGAHAARLGITTFLVRARAGDVRLLALLCERYAARACRDGAYVDLEFPVAAQ